MEIKFKHFIILNVLDVITTYSALTHMNAMEGNPILSAMFAKFGLLGSLIAVKLIGLILIYGMLSMMPLNIKKIALYIICSFFTIVIINNAYQMIRVL
jgi:hypothetical protein